MQTEINKICESIPLIPATAEPDGLKRSLDEPVKINGCVAAENLCYFCIKTLFENLK